MNKINISAASEYDPKLSEYKDRIQADFGPPKPTSICKAFCKSVPRIVPCSFKYLIEWI